MHKPHVKAMAALLRRSQPRHDLYTVFGDCMEAMAIAMANSIDLRARNRARLVIWILSGATRAKSSNCSRNFSPNWSGLSRPGLATCSAACSTSLTFTARRGGNISHPMRSAAAWRRPLWGVAKMWKR